MVREIEIPGDVLLRVAGGRRLPLALEARAQWLACLWWRLSLLEAVFIAGLRFTAYLLFTVVDTSGLHGLLISSRRRDLFLDLLRLSNRCNALLLVCRIYLAQLTLVALVSSLEPKLLVAC